MLRLTRGAAARVAFACAATVAVSGCGDDDPPRQAVATTSTSPVATAPPTSSPSSWIEVDVETGAVAAPGFNEFIAANRPEWAATPSGAARVLVGQQSEEGEELDVDALGDGAVTVTIDGLADDSIEAVRYDLRFSKHDDGLYRFDGGMWSQRCRAGRGHDKEFLAEPCV